MTAALTITALAIWVLAVYIALPKPKRNPTLKIVE